MHAYIRHDIYSNRSYIEWDLYCINVSYWFNYYLFEEDAAFNENNIKVRYSIENQLSIEVDMNSCRYTITNRQQFYYL